MCTGRPPAPDMHATHVVPPHASSRRVADHPARTRCEPPHRRCPLALRTRRAPPCPLTRQLHGHTLVSPRRTTRVVSAASVAAAVGAIVDGRLAGIPRA